MRDEILTLRRDHRWRLAFPMPPGPPKHSPYIAPFCEAFSKRPKHDSDSESSSDTSSDCEDSDKQDDSDSRTEDTESSD